MEITSALLQAIKTDLVATASAWMVTSVHETSHKRLALSGQTLAEVVDRHVTMVLESSPRKMALVFMLEGPANGPLTSCKISYGGNVFETNDASLIAALESKIPESSEFFQGVLLSKLMETI